MRDFRDLVVSQKAHRLTVAVYRATQAFPVATNLAEGCGRLGDRELARFVAIAAGSASETEHHLLLACDLGYIPRETHQELNGLVNEVKETLRSLHEKPMAAG